MKKLHCLIAALTIISLSAFGGGDVKSNSDKSEIRYIKESKRLPDASYQEHLRNQPAWQNFISSNGKWFVIFNEENGKPHRAFGKPVAVQGFTAKERADNFISSKLNEMKIPAAELNFSNSINSGSYEYVNYTQKHNGLEVLNSRLEVKLTSTGKVVMFAADVFDDIIINTSPALTPETAIEKAKTGITGSQVVGASISPDVKILPVPDYKKNEYKLVYEVTVKTMDENNFPSVYYTLVDANTGDVLYRHDNVVHAHNNSANTDVTVTGTVYPTNPYDPSAVMPLRNLSMVAGAQYNTDQSGYVGLTNTSPVSATFSLQGYWSTVRTGGTTPTFSATLNPGTNNISFDANANVKERSAYYHVNIIHDYMKTKYPSFTGMDFSLPTNVDVAGNCNAYYDGSSINFYAAGGGCTSYAQVGDIIYHEYGHGINDNFYQSFGSYFANGAMGEGYADTWAIGVTNNPVLGLGNSSTDGTEYIRRYDINKKVYPKDLVGEVHADGEIIAGAWWDVSQNLGNHQQMMDLYSQTFYGLVTGPDGSEGQVYVDILVEALQDDDAVSNGGDGDITTGTPNDNAIVDAFALHGITLLSNVSINHTPVIISSGTIPVTINASLTNVQYPWALAGVDLFYKINRTGSWNSLPMNNTTANDYTVDIPAQPNGTIINYYLALQNSNGTFTGSQPVSADLVDPNIPYFILNGFDTLQTDDFDNTTMGNWITGISGDDATTGKWIIDSPIGTFYNSTEVQPNSQHTPVDGFACALTGNGNDPTALGENDVDGGETTLESPALNLSAYTNPAISFYRWYTNNAPTSANPGNDFWEVQISNDGTNWVKVERTDVADASWRLFAFRIKDYVSLSSNIKLRFVAEDSVITGGYLSGGSLVEAAIDDIALFEEDGAILSVKNTSLTLFNVYPNPAKNEVYINFSSPKAQEIKLSLVNELGQMVYSSEESISSGPNKLLINTTKVAPGIYSLYLISEGNIIQSKLSVIR